MIKEEIPSTLKWTFNQEYEVIVSQLTAKKGQRTRSENKRDILKYILLHKFGNSALILP